MQNKTNRLEKPTIQEELNKAMNCFMTHQIEEAIAVVNHLEMIKVPVSEQGKVQKVVMLLLLGTLYDIDTLKKLLSLLGIKSNNYSKIWQKLSHKQIYDLFVMSSRQLFSKEFTKLLGQSESSQSRAEITIVGDDSVFKQWLKNVENDPFYGKFFSGQFQKAVYGYCVSLVGVVLHDTFYPLSFSLVPKVQAKTAANAAKLAKNTVKTVENVVKTTKNAVKTVENAVKTTENVVKMTENAVKTVENALKTVENAVKIVGNVVKTTENVVKTTGNAAKTIEDEVKELERKKSLIQLEKGVKEVKSILVELSTDHKKELPTLYLSIDSGFNNKELLDFCEELKIIGICVAKGNEVLLYKDKKMNFRELIDTEFLKAEKAFYNDKKNENKSFSLRLRVYYQKLKRFVTILIFRFNGSKKLTVIFSYDKNIFAKTLRRHFFQRTQIEQFFRMVKHTLYINQSKSTDYKSFIKKVAIFFLKAIFAFAFRDYCRKHFRRFKKFSFYKLRSNILHHNADKSMLLKWL
jgi:hypothetical protein